MSRLHIFVHAPALTHVAVEEAKSIALNLFIDRRLSYTAYWTEKFIDDKG